jgi:NAD(P)-dependent dehydrogenase (short-subunit alcohol dehydrogenase family)
MDGMTNDLQSDARPLAVITGASRGLGRAVARSLAYAGWQVIADARHEDDLDEAFAGRPDIELIVGDVTDPVHRDALMAAVAQHSGLDLLVNNASTLGPSPLPAVRSYPPAALRSVFEVNVLAPLELTQRLLPALRDRSGVVVNISSDAAVEPYAGWSGYGASKAALDQLSAVLGVEEPAIEVYAFDPGDMRTAMHQLAYPGEDITDRPEPEVVVPSLLRLIDARPPGGRYRARDLAVEAMR